MSLFQNLDPGHTGRCGDIYCRQRWSLECVQIPVVYLQMRYLCQLHWSRRMVAFLTKLLSKNFLVLPCRTRSAFQMRALFCGAAVRL